MFDADAVATAYIIIVFLILLGAWLRCKDLTTALKFTALVIVTALMLNEAAFDKTRKDILQYIRTSACYKKREFNTVKFSLDVLKHSCL